MKQKEYEMLKARAIKVRNAEERSLNRWYDKYEEYYPGERDVLYAQYRNEIHNAFNSVMDFLQEKLLEG